MEGAVSDRLGRIAFFLVTGAVVTCAAFALVTTAVPLRAEAPSQNQPPVEAPLFRVTAYAHDYSKDRVALSIVNNAPVTLSAMIVEVQFVTAEGLNETKQFLFKNVDAGSEGYEQASWSGYWLPVKAIVREVSVCKLESKYYKDCGAYFAATPQSDKANNIPVELKIH
jgi:hypothetical protein